MNLWEFILAIVIVSAIVKIVTARHQAQPTPLAPASNGDTARLQDDVRQLRERIQVLERVITDGHPVADLDRQIERLRDR